MRRAETRRSTSVDPKNPETRELTGSSAEIEMSEPSVGDANEDAVSPQTIQASLLRRVLQRLNADSHWWVWVQFAVLIVSLAVNVVLWLDSRQQERIAKAARYNDQAWLALAEYEKEAGALSKRFDLEVNPLLPLVLFGADPYPWSESEEETVVHWAEDAATSVTKLGQKLSSYESALAERPAAFEFSQEAIQRLLPKANMISSALIVRKRELEEQMELLDEALAGLPHAGPRMDLHRREARFERARKALNSIDQLAPRPHGQWVEW